jgi:hypothetical protein
MIYQRNQPAGRNMGEKPTSMRVVINQGGQIKGGRPLPIEYSCLDLERHLDL